MHLGGGDEDMEHSHLSHAGVKRRVKAHMEIAGK